MKYKIARYEQNNGHIYYTTQVKIGLWNWYYINRQYGNKGSLSNNITSSRELALAVIDKHQQWYTSVNGNQIKSVTVEYITK